jgi:protein-tyrosine phosphatase
VRRVEDYSLWVGHAGDVADPRALVAQGIRAVIDLALNESPVALPRELVSCRFPLVDGPGNPPWVLRAAVETVAALLRAGTPTLVCCSAGMSRSPCIAAAAIARVRGCSTAEGLMLVLRSGPADVSPGLWAEIQAEEPDQMHVLYRPE